MEKAHLQELSRDKLRHVAKTLNIPQGKDKVDTIKNLEDQGGIFTSAGKLFTKVSPGHYRPLGA